MPKPDYPVTSAVRVWRQYQVEFEPLVYKYQEHGGAKQLAVLYDLPEHEIVKTIVLQNENKQGLVVLMHGDQQVSTRDLARQLGMKYIEPASAQQAQKWTGYQLGGTSPFGMKNALPVYVEESIWYLDRVYINGGKRGFVVRLAVEALQILQPQTVRVAV